VGGQYRYAVLFFQSLSLGHTQNWPRPPERMTKVGYHQLVSFDLRGHVSADGFASFEIKCKFRPRQAFAIFSVVTKSSRLSRWIKFQITTSRYVYHNLRKRWNEYTLTTYSKCYLSETRLMSTRACHFRKRAREEIPSPSYRGPPKKRRVSTASFDNSWSTYNNHDTSF
jgi:hypothetical protein